MTESPILETARLILRTHRAADFDALHALWTHPETYRHITGRPSRSEESWSRLLRYAGHWQIMGYGYWAIEDKSSSRFVGEAGFADYHREMEPSFGDTPEMGWLIDPAHHGKGFGSEATARILEWGRANLVSADCACIISPGNTASVALARKLGFMETGTASYLGDTVLLMRLRLRD